MEMTSGIVIREDLVSVWIVRRQWNVKRVWIWVWKKDPQQQSSAYVWKKKGKNIVRVSRQQQVHQGIQRCIFSGQNWMYTVSGQKLDVDSQWSKNCYRELFCIICHPCHSWSWTSQNTSLHAYAHTCIHAYMHTYLSFMIPKFSKLQ
jgi:hypothetical protein